MLENGFPLRNISEWECLNYTSLKYDINKLLKVMASHIMLKEGEQERNERFSDWRIAKITASAVINKEQRILNYRKDLEYKNSIQADIKYNGANHYQLIIEFQLISLEINKL